MSHENAKQLQIYGEATRVFVDYVEYTREECIFYYNILSYVYKGEALSPSSYLISGLSKVINSHVEYKSILERKFYLNNAQTFGEMAEELGITRQGMLLRFEYAYKKIRAQDYEYDIPKRMEMLKNALAMLEARVSKHKDSYCKSSLPLAVLPLNSRAQYSLKQAGVKTIGQFMQMTRAEFAAIEGVGEKTLEDILENQAKLLACQRIVGKPFIVASLGLSARATNRLKRMGIETLEQFLSLSKEQVFATWGAGEKTWQEIYNKQQQLKLGDI